METLFPSLVRRLPGRIRPSLDRLTDALHKLGNPQRAFSSVLVVGTNGKGSTAAMLERILSAGGARTGLATSPHLVRVNERIRVDGCEIGDRSLGAILNRLEAFQDLTFFETLTAAAFVWFAQSGVDVAILEAGMGGRWDASRAAGSAVAGLTNVGTDHQRWLGESAEAIARDKGAALASAEIGVYGMQVDPWVQDRLALANAREASTWIDLRTSPPGVLEARWSGSDWVHLAVPLEGEHQKVNLHLALAMAEACRELGWVDPLSPEGVAEGLSTVDWPGRLSWVQIGDRSILLDGAHNIEAVESLADFLRQQPSRFNLVFSCLDDKPVGKMAEVLEPVVADVVLCPLEDPRGMAVDVMLEAFPGAAVAGSPAEAVAHLDDPVLVVGSLRLVGAMMAIAESCILG
jgi:dihydrofolate synthase/folylpolyglutamate synthase